jgi:enoyl-CoA hydratase
MSLLIERHGPVAVLTLNRPEKLNALNNQLISALTTALVEMELDRSVRVIVVTGAARAFSAGADIAEFQAHMKAGPAEAIAHFMRPGHRLTRRIEGYPKPVIAAVNGLAFGGGCELVESIHLAFAADTAVFSKAEVNIGIIPTFGGTQRLPRHVGRKAAVELILSGRQFDAKEALDLGLVNRIVTGNKLLKKRSRLRRSLPKSHRSRSPRRSGLSIAAWMRQLTTGLPSKKPPSRALCRRTMPMKAWRPS